MSPARHGLRRTPSSSPRRHPQPPVEAWTLAAGADALISRLRLASAPSMASRAAALLEELVGFMAALQLEDEL